MKQNVSSNRVYRHIKMSRRHMKAMMVDMLSDISHAPQMQLLPSDDVEHSHFNQLKNPVVPNYYPMRAEKSGIAL